MPLPTTGSSQSLSHQPPSAGRSASFLNWSKSPRILPCPHMRKSRVALGSVLYLLSVAFPNSSSAFGTAEGLPSPLVRRSEGLRYFSAHRSHPLPWCFGSRKNSARWGSGRSCPWRLLPSICTSSRCLPAALFHPPPGNSVLGACHVLPCAVVIPFLVPSLDLSYLRTGTLPCSL